MNRISKGDTVFIFLYAFTALLYKWKKPASLHPVLQAAHGVEGYLFVADILSLSLPTAMNFWVILMGRVATSMDFFLVTVNCRPFPNIYTLLNFTKINLCVYLHLICTDRILSLRKVKCRCMSSSDWDINSPYIWLFRTPLLMHDYQLQQKFWMCKRYRVTFQMMSVRAPGMAHRFFVSAKPFDYMPHFFFLPLLQGKLTHLITPRNFLPIKLFGYLPGQVLQSYNRFFSRHEWRCLQWLYKAGTRQPEPCQYPSLLAFNTVVIPVMSLSQAAVANSVQMCGGFLLWAKSHQDWSWIHETNFVAKCLFVYL